MREREKEGQLWWNFEMNHGWSKTMSLTEQENRVIKMIVSSKMSMFDYELFFISSVVSTHVMDLILLHICFCTLGH